METPEWVIWHLRRATKYFIGSQQYRRTHVSM